MTTRQGEALAFLRNALHRCDQEGIDPKETVVNVYRWYQQEHAKKWRRMSDDEERPAIGTKVRIAPDICTSDLMNGHRPGDIVTITGWASARRYGVYTGYALYNGDPNRLYWLRELEIEE